MRLKIGICDDDADQRNYLAERVRIWAGGNRHLIELEQYPGAKEFLFSYEESKDFDILLLDVEMPEVSGIELAKQVRSENTAVQIVFITGYYEYFSDGFDVSALHYLIKPADEAKLYPVLDRAVHNLSCRQRCVLLATGEADIKVPLTDILYAEAENVYVNVHTMQGNYRVRMSLGKFVEQMDETFYKAHRSYVVSLKYISKITRKEITMINGDVVPLSRGVYNEIHTALIRYL